MIRFFAEKSAISDYDIHDFDTPGRDSQGHDTPGEDSHDDPRLITLRAEDAAHIKSLRLRPSEFFVVCDGEGSDHICRLSERGTDPVAEIVETRPSMGEPNVLCSVYIALAKGDRLDYAVQKSVELGAYEIFIYPSQRCVSAPGDISKKIKRLQRIALETAKQCGRGRVPEVAALPDFGTAVKKAANAALPLFFYELEDNRHLKDVLGYDPIGPWAPISIMTGPEGGFEPHEVELALSSAMLAVSLGPRILRCETAPAAALAAIMFHSGNL